MTSPVFIMASDGYTRDLNEFLNRALETQSRDSEELLTEEKLREIANYAGISDEDWEALCGRLRDHLAKGRNFLKFSNFADAISELEHAFAIAPYRADVVVDCGIAHFENWKEAGSRSSRDRAEELFRRGLEIDPENEAAAKHISLLKNSNKHFGGNLSRPAITAVSAIVCGVLLWSGISLTQRGGDVEAPTLPAPQPGVGEGVDTGLPKVYPPAEIPDFEIDSVSAFDGDLVAHWDFNGPSLESASLTKAGKVERAKGVDGSGVQFFSGRESGLHTEPASRIGQFEAITVSAWVKPTKRCGSQIVWFGDRRGGFDPWQLSLSGNGRVSFRSDRSVTGEPSFPFRDDETRVSADGVRQMNQHVSAVSPGALPLNEWSFISGRIEKVSKDDFRITVFVNGEAVDEVQTTESINYDTDNMWISIGSIHNGEKRNYDGTIDEVRVYRTALTDDQMRELYKRPR